MLPEYLCFWLFTVLHFLQKPKFIIYILSLKPTTWKKKQELKDIVSLKDLLEKSKSWRVYKVGFQSIPYKNK